MSEFLKTSDTNLLKSIYTELVSVVRELRRLQYGSSNQVIVSTGSLTDVHNDLLSINTQMGSLITILGTLSATLTTVAAYASYMQNMNVIKDDRGQYVQVVRDFQLNELLSIINSKLDKALENTEDEL